MKKILLILFISFAFLGSAYADCYDGNRSINLSCYKSLKLGQAFSLELEYIDNDLYKLFKEENRIKNGESQPINLNTTPEI